MRKVKSDKFQKKLIREKLATVNQLAKEYLLLSRRYFELKTELKKMEALEREKALALNTAEHARQSVIDFIAGQLGRAENEPWEIDFDTMDFKAPDLPKEPSKESPKKATGKGKKGAIN